MQHKRQSNKHYKGRDDGADDFSTRRSREKHEQKTSCLHKILWAFSADASTDASPYRDINRLTSHKRSCVELLFGRVIIQFSRAKITRESPPLTDNYSLTSIKRK